MGFNSAFKGLMYYRQTKYEMRPQLDAV